MKVICFCIMLVVLNLADNFAQSYKPAANFGIYMDQDYFADFLDNQDRNYTQGTAFSYSQLGHETLNHLFLPLNAFYRLAEVLGLPDPTRYEELPATVSFGVSAFTPLNIRSYIPEYGDRPYSNIVFLETRRARIVGRTFRSWSFTYGFLGTNVGKEFQSFAHANIAKGRGIPLGWDTQISQGGRFAWLVQNVFKAPIRIREYDKALRSLRKSRLNWDATYGIESAAGYYTYFGGNLGLRIGKINFLNFRNSRSSGIGVADKILKDKLSEKVNNSKVILQKNRVDDRVDWEHFLFASFSPRLFVNNNLISGQPNRSSGYSLDSKYLSTFVSETEVGLTTTRSKYLVLRDKDDESLVSSLDNYFQISLSVKRRSPEYKYPGFTRAHYWGCISLLLPIPSRGSIF